MVKKISLSKLTHNELITLCSRILIAIEASVKINTGIVATILALVKQGYEKFVPIINRSLKTVHAEILKAKDKIRDDAFRALRDAVLANSRRLNDASRLHAKLLLEIFIRNGWDLYADNYQDESAELNHLFTELDRKDAQEALTSLGLIDWYLELKAAQIDFEDAFQSKANDTGKEDFVAIGKIRPDLVNNLYDLLERINSDSKYANVNGDYKEILNTINNIISETATLAKSRITRGTGEEVQTVGTINSGLPTK